MALDVDMRRQVAIDREIAALTGAQYGVVARRQLLAFGLSPQKLDRRVRSVRLHVVHRGVYAVGHPVLTQEGRWMAAVLAACRGAVLSHGSAAAASDLRPALDLADQRHLIDFAELRQRRLPRSLQVVLTLYAQTITRSDLEERFLALCDDHDLPRPATNTIVEGREVHFVWRDARLIVEVDGYRWIASAT